MRLVSFVDGSHERLGFLVGDAVIDPRRALPGGSKELADFTDAVTFIKSGARGLAVAERIIRENASQAKVPLKQVRLAAPMLPSTILCTGSNYRDHNKEKANTAISGKEPEFFIKTADSVIGPGEAIICDAKLTKKLDCETELAIVIGKPGRHIPIQSALDHVFGYTIVNDVTARDRQVRKTPEGSIWYDLGRGKSFDTSAPLGPCIVTADEVGDPQNLTLRTRINGDLRQSTSTSNMIWTCAELIHFFSESFTLKPGMVIITGTPAGTAWSTDPELGGKWQAVPGLVAAKGYCQPGDVVECELEKIGVLSNRVVANPG
jgi:2-keto-4-pentenoate hydratase/2-oxohepta-3-ene-1,7-dioic acid hydratase in catechol pathway